jgi:hypothetical protein
MQDAIRKLPTSKAAGLDRILNEVIKAILEAITLPLANTASFYLYKGKLLECYKEITIVILRKVNKKDYSLPGSYWPVALKNTLGKLLEKIVIERI